MDKVFDVLNEENRRFAKLQEDTKRSTPAHDRAEWERVVIPQTKRCFDQKKKDDLKLSHHA
jgi:hypothetical protein